MRRSTIIGCFVGLLSLTLSAQSTQSPQSLKGSPTIKTEIQKQRPANSNQVIKGLNGKSSVVPKLLSSAVNPRPHLKNEATKKAQYTPLFVPQDAVANGLNLAPKATQFIYQNPFIYGSRDSGLEKQQPTISLEELLLRLQANGNQTGIDMQEFTPAERQVLKSYFSSQNSNRSPQATLLTEGFDDITTLPGAGYSFVNASDVVGLTDWFQGNATVFNSQAGAPTAYIGANFNNTAGSVINNFMITPVLNLENGDEIKFWTRTTTASAFPDRLEIRLDPTGANTDPSGPTSVGSYTELLLEINPTLVTGVYPDVWTEFTVTVAGLTGAIDTRVAFRYWVTDGGPAGNNSDFIGIDTLSIEEGTGGGGGSVPTVFGLNLRASCSNDFGSFPLAGPYTIDPIATNTNPIYGGDFDGAGTLYAFNGTLATLLTLDTTTGAETTVAPITGLLATETLRGIAWNESNSTMYLMAGIGEVGSIYTVDLTTGTATLVGSTTITGWLPIWLAIDSNGNAFMADIGLDSLYSVDLSTGTSTLVGALGVNINFAQDADFDPDTDTLYMGGYLGGGVNVWASVDTATGVATALGSVNTDCAEMGIVAIKGAGGGGGSTTPCSQADASNAFENGYGNTNNTVEIADEIIVAADTDFEVNQLTINLINNGGFNSVDVAFYEDAGGMPGAMVGSIMTIVPTSSTAIGVAFGRDVLEIVLDIAPGVMLNGTAGSETVYWIGVETPNPVDPVSDAYWETTSVQNTGTDYLVHYDVANGGWTSTPPVDNLWNTVYTVSGNCETMGGGGPDLCSQTQTSNAFENGLFMEAGGQLIANDFILSPSKVNFSVESITANLFAQGGIASVDILFLEDNAGLPGAQIGTTFANIVPTSQNIIGSNFGFDIHETVIDLPAPVDFAGSGTNEEKIYWVQIVGYPTVSGTQIAWEVTTASIIGNSTAFDNLTGTWTASGAEDGVFTIDGICTFVPCPQPSDLVVSNITETTADLAWSAEPNATSGYEWFVFNAGDDPATATPVDSGVAPAGTTTATADGLTNATSYDFYVSSDCGATGTSFLSGPVMFETLITPPGCGGKFYDTGGATGNYENSANVTTVINPDNAGDQVTVTFTAFDVEATWDALYVYDGPDASAPIISSGNPATNSGFPAGGYYGTTIPGPFTSSHASGALTFVFLSDASVPRAGWEADVTCAPTPPPNDMIVNSIDVDEVSGFPPYTDSQVNMPAATLENGSPAGCDLTGANGVWYNFVAFQDGTANATIVTPGGASSVTFYTAPNENAVETDLTLVPQSNNQCAPGTSASIFTLAGQAYYVFVLNTGAVTDIIIDGTNLGVADNTIAGFSYYPNPTNGVLNLNSIDNIDTISMYNLLGQLVIENQVNATASQVDISGLSTGTYIMKVTVNGQIGTYKVLKQ